MIDPTMYGGTASPGVVIPEVPEKKPLELTPANPEPVGSITAGTTTGAQAAAMREEATRERAGYLDSAIAATRLWDTSRIVDRVARVDFGPADNAFHLGDFLQALPDQLNEEELEFMQEARNAKHAEYNYQYIQRLREAQKIAGDNPVTGFMAQMLDPAWVAAGVASGGLATAARAGRLGAAAIDVAATGGIASGREGPAMTPTEFAINAVAGSSLAALTYRKGAGLGKADPDFPDEALKGPVADLRVAQARFQADFVGPAPFGVAEVVKPKYREIVTPGTPAVTREVVEEIPGTPAVYKEVTEEVPGVPAVTRTETVVDGPVPLGPVVSQKRTNDIVEGTKHLIEFEDGTRITLSRETNYGTIKGWYANELDGWLGDTKADAIKRAAEILTDRRRGTPRQIEVEVSPAVPPSTVTRQLLVTPEVPARRSVRVEEVAPATPETRQWVKVGDVTVRQAREQPELVLHADAAQAAPEVIEAAVEARVGTWAQEAGQTLQWNLKQKFARLGPAGKKVSDILFGDAGVEANKLAVRTELHAFQIQFEDTLRQVLAENGAGMFQRIVNPRKAAAVQARIERDVRLELYRREMLASKGLAIDSTGVPKHIKDMADKLDATHAAALRELKAAGVEGAEAIQELAGWHSRRWSPVAMDQIKRKLMAAGLDDKAAHAKLVALVARGVRLANRNFDEQLAKDWASSIVNRTFRKGLFEDNGGPQAGVGELNFTRDMLKEEGIPHDRIERILKAMEVKTSEQGKASFLKHRVDLDYRATTYINGEAISVADLLDNRLSTTVDQYLDGVSGQVAMARAGYRSMTDVQKLRTELLAEVPMDKGADISKTFDEVVNFMYGRPAGQEMNQNLRLMGMYGRMIALANSGIWQFTEWATMMSRYGAMNTLKYALKEAPGLRKLMGSVAKDPALSRQLVDILTYHSEKNLRLRPYIHRFEDNFEIGANATMQLAAGQAGQLVPYVNVMKYIHSHQARAAANLILDRLRAAANGDAKAIQALGKYGLESQVMVDLSAQIKRHGFDVDAWDDGVWAKVRPHFGVMMDEAVLHGRLGDTPAFVAFDQAGKFIFTYRSFVLAAHNKLLAGGLERHGGAPVALMLAYQFPLAALAVQAKSASQGKGALSEEDMVRQGLGQMGGLGFFAEILGVAMGDKALGSAPGLIPVDRVGKFIGSATGAAFGDGSAGRAVSDGVALIPLVGIAQPAILTRNLIKE